MTFGAAPSLVSADYPALAFVSPSPSRHPPSRPRIALTLILAWHCPLASSQDVTTTIRRDGRAVVYLALLSLFSACPPSSCLSSASISVCSTARLSLDVRPLIAPQIGIARNHGIDIIVNEVFNRITLFVHCSPTSSCPILTQVPHRF